MLDLIEKQIVTVDMSSNPFTQRSKNQSVADRSHRQLRRKDQSPSSTLLGCTALSSEARAVRTAGTSGTAADLRRLWSDGEPAPP